LSLKHLAQLSLLVAFTVLGSPAWATGINIYFKTAPPLEHLRPFADPVTLSLLITGADGKPIAQGWADIVLEAPKPGRFFSTDFPLVEGRRLLEMRLPLKGGKTEWKYLFPIRGEHRLTVDVVTREGLQTSKTFAVKIKEYESKWYFLGAFTLGLFVFGVIAGRIFTRALPRGISKAILFTLAVEPFLAPSDAYSAGLPTQGKYFGWIDIGPASVGIPTRVSWRLQAEGGGSRPAAALTLTMTHVEKGKTVFSVERVSVSGEFAINFQFPEGGEYRLSAIAYIPGSRVVRTERDIFVNAVEPPANTVIPAIGFFLAVIAGGLGVGRWSRRAAPSPE
jgi:hypothetical protein